MKNLTKSIMFILFLDVMTGCGASKDSANSDRIIAGTLVRTYSDGGCTEIALNEPRSYTAQELADMKATPNARCPETLSNGTDLFYKTLVCADRDEFSFTHYVYAYDKNPNALTGSDAYCASHF